MVTLTHSAFSPRLSLRKACALTGLLALLPLAAHAQTGGHWSGPSYDCTGTLTSTDGFSYPWIWRANPYYANSGISCYWAYRGPRGTDGFSGTIKSTFTWVPDPNNPNETPTPLYIKETASMGAASSTNSTADDGLGDAALIYTSTNNGYSQNSASSHGSHLAQQGTNSPVTITRSLSAQSVRAQMNMSYQAQTDSRAVAVSSSLGQTYSKGANDIPVPNVRASDGSITDDTVVPDPSTGTSATYQAHRAGTWGSDSTYQWTNSLTGYTASGPFNSSSPFGNQTIPDFSGVYTNPPATAGKSNTVTLTLTDGSDGSTGSNTATVRFHDPYEGWQHATNVQVHPISLSGAIDAPHPDWSYLLVIDNNSSQPLTQSLNQSTTLSTTESGTIGGEASLGPLGVAALKANESITVGHEHSVTYGTTTTFTGGPHKRTAFFAAMSYEVRTGGRCDVYGGSGYDGTADWTGVWSSGQVSPGSIEENKPQVP